MSSAALDGSDPRTVFRADTSVYDVLVHVKRAAVPRASQRLWAAETASASSSTRDGAGGSAYKNLSLAAKGELPRVEHDPPQLLLADLVAEHDDVASFFYDK